MLYHLTDIFVNTNFNYHFCPIVLPLKFAFTYSTNNVFSGNKNLKSKQNIPLRYYTETVQKKKANVIG